ncbi:MAG: exopolysaccharide biosynthesis protein [Proteobacteria bacterium]|nr:exopolysaccharide biosynthesis protein [Pseudomonadota bacterium]
MTDPSEPIFPSGAPPEKTSQLLRQFADQLGGERVSLEDVVASLGDRGLGVLMAIFAVPNIFPAPIPFGNVIFGIPVIILAVHLMLGWPRLVLPKSIARRSIGASVLKSITPRLAGMLARIEPLLKPRLPAVSTPAAERVIGLICVVLSILSALPIPFGHMVPALALMVIGLGLIEHDGVAILLGAALGIAGVLVFGLVVFGLASGLSHLI